MEQHYDTLAIIVAILGTGIALWLAGKASTDRLHNDMRNVQRDIGDLRERMARLEGTVDVLAKVLAAPKRPAPGEAD